MRFIYAIALSIVSLLYCPSMALSQQADNMGDALRGELTNGFRYIIKENPHPGNRIYFRLVMNVGSLQEQRGEEGVAHFIEHLAFRNTTRFPDAGIVRKLESFGEKYGETINAYTGYDRTVYMFSIPADVPDAISLGVNIASEWLSHIVFDDKTVENEKNIIYEEIDGYRSAECFDLLKKGTDTNLHRFPIATKEQVKRITPKELKQFYRRCYQPRNATLIIVGARVREKLTEQKIKELFGSIHGDATRRVVQKPLQYNFNEAFEVCTDENNRNAALEWIYPVVAQPILTTSQRVADEKERFVLAMLNTRLRKKNNPMRLHKHWYLNHTAHLCFVAEARTDSLLLRDFREGVAIVEGIRQKGFSNHEKEMQLKAFRERSQNHHFNYTSEQWCNHFIEMLLVQSADVVSETENQQIAKAIENTSLNEWNRCTRQLLQPMDEKNMLVGYRYAPKRHKRLTRHQIIQSFESGCSRPDTAQFIIKSKQAVNHCPYDEAFLNTPIQNKNRPTDSEKFYPDLQLHEITLNNGARLLLRPTTNNDSVVSVTMLFRGGLSEIPAEKYPLLESVASYMSMGGIEGVDDEIYSNALFENELSVINTMELDWHGMMASGKTNNLLQLANLIRQRCFAPKRCYTDFDEIKADLREQMQRKDTSAMRRMIAADAERMLRKRVDEVIGNTLPHEREISVSEIEQLDLDSIAAFYHRLYTRATGLTCIVTGNFDISDAKAAFVPMLHQFNSIEGRESSLSKASKYPLKAVEKVANATEPERVAFDYLYVGDFSGGLRDVLMLKLMREIIRKHIIDELRNNSGLIYSPYVNLHRRSMPTPTFCLDINGEVHVDNAAAVKSKIESIMLRLRRQPITREELDAIKRSFLLNKSNFLTSASYANWKEYLMTCVKDNIDFSDAEMYEHILSEITSQDILSAFRKWLSSTQKAFLFTGDYYENKK